MPPRYWLQFHSILRGAGVELGPVAGEPLPGPAAAGLAHRFARNLRFPAGVALLEDDYAAKAAVTGKVTEILRRDDAAIDHMRWRAFSVVHQFLTPDVRGVFLAAVWLRARQMLRERHAL